MDSLAVGLGAQSRANRGGVATKVELSGSQLVVGSQ